MIGLFANRRTKVAAAAIDHLCNAIRYANQNLGDKAGVQLLSRHDVVTSHRQPSEGSGAHEFRLGRDLEDFRFLVYDNEDMVQAFGMGDFAGFGITTQKGRGYHVFVTQPLTRPTGHHSRMLARRFVRRYGARDLTDLAR